MLPKQLKFGSKVESAAAKSSRVNIAPQNGSGPYNLGDTIIINLPTRASLVLCPTDSYLKFDVGAMTCAAADNAVRWDSCGAHGLIQRIRIFHGSNLLQDIDNYNLLTKMLFDIQVPTDAAFGKLNILAGTRSDLSIDTGASVAANSILSAVQTNSGDLIRSATTGATWITDAAGRTSAVSTYCLNLNCLLGTLCSQNYFPLFACTSAPLRLEITLVDNILKALNSVLALVMPAAGLLTNVEYVANFIELGDSAMSVVAGSLQGQPLQFVVPDYRNYQYSYALTNGTATQVSFCIPAKFSSLKSIFITIRDKNSGVLKYFPMSSVTAAIIDYQFRIGASIFPPKAPNTLPEMFAEVVKAIGSMSDLNFTPSIDKASYMMATSVQNTVALESVGGSNVSSGSFYIGIDLENYINAPKDNCFAGWNSNTDDIFAIMNFGIAVTSNTYRFDAFAMFDSCVVFENGTAYVRY
jgi:hypothetical protein